MRRVSLIIVAILLITSAGWAQDGAGTISFYANTGMTLPVQPEALSDYWNSGLNFGGGIGYDFSKYVAMQGYFNYNTFGFNKDKFSDDFGISSVEGGGFKIITAMVNVKASFIARGNKVIPYFIGGLGMFSMSEDDITYLFNTYPGDSKTTLGSVIGFGIDFMLMENAGIFAEFSGGAGAVELETGIPGTEDGPVGYGPLKIGAFFQLK